MAICRLCDKSFITPYALQQHVRDSPAHYSYRCIDCNRNFLSEKALRQHESSPLHHPLTASLACPKCKVAFPAGPSSLLQHLESGGTCAKKLRLNRASIRRFVVSADPDQIITLPGATNVVSTPATVGSTEEPTEQDVDQVVLLPRHQCTLCPKNAPQFVSVKALQNHLASAAHDPLVYACPTPLLSDDGKHRRSFKTLSGLSQHMESQACVDGLEGYWKLLDAITNKLGALGISFRLADRPSA